MCMDCVQMIDIILDEGDDGGSAGGTSFSGSTLSPHTFSSGVRMLELPSFLTGKSLWYYICTYTCVMNIVIRLGIKLSSFKG